MKDGRIKIAIVAFILNLPLAMSGCRNGCGNSEIVVQANLDNSIDGGLDLIDGAGHGYIINGDMSTVGQDSNRNNIPCFCVEEDNDDKCEEMIRLWKDLNRNQRALPVSPNCEDNVDYKSYIILIKQLEALGNENEDDATMVHYGEDPLGGM